MAQPARTYSPEAPHAPLPRPEPSHAPVPAIDTAGGESPARLLHARLIETFAAPQAPEMALPLPARLAVILTAAAACWALVIAAVMAIA